MRYCLNQTMIKSFESLNHNYSIRHAQSAMRVIWERAQDFWFGADNDPVTEEILSMLNI